MDRQPGTFTGTDHNDLTLIFFLVTFAFIILAIHGRFILRLTEQDSRQTLRVRSVQDRLDRLERIGAPSSPTTEGTSDE